MRLLLATILMALFTATAAGTETPKFIVLTTEECDQVATEVANQVALAHGLKVEPVDLTARAAVVSAYIIEHNPKLRTDPAVEPQRVYEFLVRMCVGADGVTDIPEPI